jgi:hypothetical protein
MSITKTLLAGVAGTVLVGSGAFAGEPVQLSDTQMDDVTAGVFAYAEFSDVIGFTLLGRVRSEGSFFTEATEEVEVGGSPFAFSLVERANARASVRASFTGGGGVATPFGVYAEVGN